MRNGTATLSVLLLCAREHRHVWRDHGPMIRSASACLAGPARTEADLLRELPLQRKKKESIMSFKLLQVAAFLPCILAAAAGKGAPTPMETRRPRTGSGC